MLDPKVKELARGANFGALATVMPDGAIQNTVVWVDADDEHLLVNTETGRQKEQNASRDGRATVVIWKDGDPYTTAEVRGKVVESVKGDEARRHIDELSHKYTGADYANPITTERVILKIAPDRQLTRG